jgi:2-isopropylmalate synthase
MSENLVEVKNLKEYVNINAPLALIDYHFVRSGDTIKALITVEFNGEIRDISATGNGRLDAVSNALKKNLSISYSGLTYTEHALQTGSSSQAVSYVSITDDEGKVSWGAGIHADIIASSICALFSAINKRLV